MKNDVHYVDLKVYANKANGLLSLSKSIKQETGFLLVRKYFYNFNKTLAIYGTIPRSVKSKIFIQLLLS